MNALCSSSIDYHLRIPRDMNIHFFPVFLQLAKVHLTQDTIGEQGVHGAWEISQVQ